MALPKCRRCGKQDPQRMHGLMSLWFAPLIELEADLGYFYLCPVCHDEVIVPELERIQNRILELHPAAHRTLEEEWAEQAAEEASEARAAAAATPGAGGGAEASGAETSQKPETSQESETGRKDAATEDGPDDADSPDSDRNAD